MTRFRFRLQRVLDLRRALTGLQRQRLELATQKRRQQERLLAAARERFDALAAEACQREAAGMPATELVWVRGALERAAERIELECAGLAAASQLVAEERERLVQRRREQRSLERLAARRRAAHAAAARAAEQNAIDELAGAGARDRSPFGGRGG